MDRRAFSKSLVGSLALTATGFSLNSLAAVLGIDQPDSDCYSCDGFRQLIGQRFLVSGQEDCQLELATIEVASKTRPDEQFYLRFRKTGASDLNEGLYQLSSQSGRPLMLSLSPSYSQPEYMEAVVNLRPAI